METRLECVQTQKRKTALLTGESTNLESKIYSPNNHKYLTCLIRNAFERRTRRQFILPLRLYLPLHAKNEKIIMAPSTRLVKIFRFKCDRYIYQRSKSNRNTPGLMPRCNHYQYYYVNRMKPAIVRSSNDGLKKYVKSRRLRFQRHSFKSYPCDAV